MNAVNKSFTKRQVQKEFAKQYDMLRTECFKQNFEDITRQTVSVMISGMLMQGYSEEQCKEIFEILVDMFAMPKFFGRAITTDVTIAKCEELGLDLNRIKVNAEIK